MCGILCIFDSQSLSRKQLRKLALSCSKLLRHRGPDWSGIYIYHCEENGFSNVLSQSNGSAQLTSDQNANANRQNSTSNGNLQNGREEKMMDGLKECKNAALAHERLAIIDPDSGAQPLKNTDQSVILLVNGEIYNHDKIREETQKEYKYSTQSDCEVILPLYAKYGDDCAKHLDGMFSFVIWDEKNKRFYAARDHIGITPLYVGWRGDGGIVFSSELKALQSTCERFEVFPPGHFFTSDKLEFTRWYEPNWLDGSRVPSGPLDLTEFRERFEKAVIKRMMSDVPWGVLLSGGLDSSLVCSVACRHAAKFNTAWPTIHTFSIGVQGSPDLAAAAKVAKYLGTRHHALTFTVQEGIDALSEVIYHLETYDVTTIRASTPMYLMARKIKAMGVKMVLSGEGADECLGGYLYFHKAPNKEAFHKETVAKLSLLHYYDCLRANKSMSAFGVEPRVPFLDPQFLDYVMTLDPEHKMVKLREGDEKRGKIEKYVLRKAFDTPENPYLPDEVLWRQKEQFSDGVGYSWIDTLRAKAERDITASQWATRAKRFPKNTPNTKEAYAYRSIFHDHFPSESARDTVRGGPSVACSTPAAIEWDEAFKKLAADVGGENSGRAVTGVHIEAYSDASKVVSGKIIAAQKESPGKKQKTV